MQYLTCGRIRQIADRHGKARVGGAAKQTVELLDLPALALPSHPEPFALVPLAQPVEQEEPVRSPIPVPGVERRDARAGRLENLRVVRLRFGRRVEKVAEDGEVNVTVDVADRLHFEMGDQIADAIHAVQEGRHDDHRPGRRRHGVEFEPRKPAGWNQRADHPLQKLDDQLACGYSGKDRDKGQRHATPAVQPRVEDSRRDDQGGAHCNGAEVPGGRPREEEPPRAPLESGLPCDAALELPPPGANQVVADVGVACVGSPHVNLPRALDALQREQQLTFSGRHGKLLDGVAIPVAAAEVHPAVDPSRIALEHLLDEAHAFEELAPIECRNQTEAANQVGHAGLFGRLVLPFCPDGVLDRLAAGRQRLFELMVQAGGDGAEGTRALK